MQRNSTGDPGTSHSRQSSFDIWPRCTCLISQPEARESEIEYSNTRKAFRSEAVAANAGVKIGMPGGSRVTPMDVDNTRTGDARGKEQICYRLEHVCEYKYGEDAVSTSMGDLANPASNNQRSTSTYSENRREEVQRAGYRGLSSQCDGTRKDIPNLVHVFPDFQEKPEGNLPAENGPCLQDISPTVGIFDFPNPGLEKIGRRESLVYRLFVAEPELYHIEPIPSPPPSFPTNILERALHDAGISTHTEYPVDDPAVTEGIMDMGGMDFPVFWLADYRNQDLNSCRNLIYRSGFLFVTPQGDLAVWMEEDGATILGNRPYEVDVQKAVVKWATWSL
ncbi:hypothetical protein BGX38DRAFT_1223013 [Terfezia claveryi]|nr:hypothetical protein BGX38DRAFT_1223013 [Terfezia claveryi]